MPTNYIVGQLGLMANFGPVWGIGLRLLIFKYCVDVENCESFKSFGFIYIYIYI